jgi:hypothetical protein
MLSSVLVSIAKSEQILQCMREVLVTDPTFTPLALFRYLAGNAGHLSRRHIIEFLDENCLLGNERETDELLKKMFARYGIHGNKGFSYTAYLNFVYPYNSGVLR